MHFDVYSRGWITDNGDALHREAKGCGLMTGWTFEEVSATERDGSDQNLGDYTSQYLARFNLPATFKKGCVGRAIRSAGGPVGVDC